MATTTSRAPTTTYNLDVLSLARRYNRVIVEVTKAQSSNVSQSMPFDVTRLKSYISSLRAYLNLVASLPLLDCPETGPTEVALPANPPIQDIENESSYGILTMLDVARDELTASQSARLPTGLQKFDLDRQISYLARIDAVLAYVSTQEPLDLPESSPMVAISGPGNTGVNV